MIPRALTVAGVDPGGGAGVLADALTFHRLGVEAAAAVTAVTVQDAGGVRAVHAVPPELVAAQIRAAGRVDAAKTGMLVSAAHVGAVADAFGADRPRAVVVDPVFAASADGTLLDEPGIEALIRLLLPLADLVTPNVGEAERLSGHPVHSPADAAEAARAIAKLGPKAVVVTGGHLEGDPVDVLYDGSDVIEIQGHRIRSKNIHGTGCRFSAAVAAALAKGSGLEAAVRTAKQFVTEALMAGPSGGNALSPFND